MFEAKVTPRVGYGWAKEAPCEFCNNNVAAVVRLDWTWAYICKGCLLQAVKAIDDAIIEHCKKGERDESR